MNILKLALLSSLKIAFFFALKAALLVYILSRPDTRAASAVPKGNGYWRIPVLAPH